MINTITYQLTNFGDVVREVKESIDIENRNNGAFHRYVAGGHMQSDDLHLREWGEINDNYLGPAFHRIFRKGQILYGSRRTYLRKVAVAHFDGITSNTTFVLEPKNNKLIQEFLPFIMQTDSFVEHSIKNSKGSTNPYITWKDLAKYQFHLPPIDEQRRIAEILWAADEVVENLYNLLSKSNNLLHQKMQDIYGFNYLRKSDAKFPNGWDFGSISKLFDVNPKFSSDVSHDLPITFLPMEAVSNDGYILVRETKRISEIGNGFTPFEEGDILFAKITPSMENGKGSIATGLTNGKGFGSTEFFVLRPKSIEDQSYIYHLAMSKSFRFYAERLMQGSAGQRRVPRDFFEWFKIPLPPAKTRKNYGTLLDDIAEVIKKQKILIQYAIFLKKGLMKNLL